MARIPVLREGDPHLDPQSQAFLQERISRPGRVGNIARVMANHPTLARAFYDFTTVFYRNGELSPKERELVYTTTTAINECFY